MAHLLSARAAVHACGALATAGWTALALFSDRPPVALPLFFGVLAVAWAALAIAWWRTAPPARMAIGAMLGWALVFRAVGLLATPVLDDDYYRYLWDGYATAELGGPYGHAPEDWFGATGVDLAFEPVLDGINNPEVPTIYPPVAQGLFLAAHRAAPASLLPIKAALILADLVVLALLWRLLGARRALIWAWCPLLVHEVAFNGHVEMLAVSLAFAALVLAMRTPRTAAACAAVGALGALAAASKLSAGFLVVLAVARLDVRGAVVALAAFAATFAVVYLPFLAPLLEAGGTPAELAGLAVFLEQWEFNSTGFALLALALGRRGASLFGLAVVLAALVAAAVHARRTRGSGDLPRAEWVFAALFAVAPVVNPWYLLWLLPFVAARPRAWAFAALAVVPLSYCHGLFLPGSLPAYHHPSWVRPLEVAIVAAAWIVSTAWRDRHPSSPGIGGRRKQGVLLRSPAVALHTGLRIALLLAAAVSLASSEALASGTYMGRPSRPSASVDRASYELGKKVFAGEFVASDSAAARASQAQILTDLQERLPKRVRARVDLTEHAGKLSDEQISALQYYLERRYKVRIDG